ncbi:MAG: molybdopterin cofactor-binding domain-containing protein [Acidimicrobiia bacterium]|nr:molybdopterin cofactor-binding domain-containing protein [Acidimicrobiia bacterium]
MSTTSALGGVVRRREDPALVTGKGQYVDDVKLTGMLHAAFVRSPYAHARITSIDADEARSMPGVKAVYTAEDVRHLGPLPAQVPVGKVRPLLADGVVKHMGEAVAMVVAATRAEAQDAADAVFVDYDVLEPVIDLKDAASDRSKVHDDLDSNILVTWTTPFGADEETQAKLADDIAAAKDRDDTVTVSLEMNNQRLLPTAIEPRSVVAQWNSGYGEMTLWSSSQMISAVAGAVGKVLGIPYNQIHGIAPEVGGGFGAKLNVYPDEILVPWASQQLGKPVKYTETRREAAVSTIQGRGWIGTATITGTRDGEVLGYELDAICDMGAYSQNFTVAIPFLGVFVGSGQYKFPTRMKLDCVTTHAQTTDAYRGAGRPEAIYYLERIVDAYAREIGMDPAEVRMKNFIAADAFPAAVSPVGFAIDTGDYATNLQAMLDLPEFAEMKAERDRLRDEGELAGLGLSTYVEVCGFGPSGLVDLGFSWAEYGVPSAFNGSGLVRVNPDGTANVIIGTGPSGQGHQTTWAQIVSQQTGIEMDKIRVTYGDTKEAPVTIGTFGSRSAAVDGAAAFEAAGKVRAKAAKVAAHLLEASEEDIRFEDGAAHVAGSPDKSVSWSEIAKVAYQPHLLPEGVEGGMEAHAIFSPGNATWPFGTMACLVTVDQDTGDVRLRRWVSVDDCGNVINPMIVDGQIHGGLAQGIGQALFEDAIYDGEGNLLTAGLIDYPMPTAGDVPPYELHRTVTPTDVNPLGVKGIGEAGTIGSAQTVVNAVVDALAHLGVKHVDMPLRPKRVWQAIQSAQN